MKIIINIIMIFSLSLLTIINCLSLCNKETNLPPTSEYHCSGLKIDNSTNANDLYCCYWSFYVNTTNKNIGRCSSINSFQFTHLNEYITNKTKQYNKLNIKCVEDQKIYCSNIILDEEQTTNCRELPISNSKDKYCCRWTFEDTDNYNKKNDYCASINEFEYLYIKEYITYKVEDPKQRYDKLKIDCKGSFLHIYIIIVILFLFL